MTKTFKMILGCGAVSLIAFMLASCSGASLSSFFPESAKLAPPNFAYVPGDTDISAFTVDPNTGGLTAVSGSPFAVCHGDHATTNPAGTFLFLIGDDCGNISVFSIDGASGALTAVPGSPFTGGGISTPENGVVNPTGTVLYVPDSDVDSVAAFNIAADGSLTPVSGSPFLYAGGAFDGVGINITPDGRFVYISTDGGMLGYSVDTTSGALTSLPGSPFVSAGAASAQLAMDQAGHFLFAADGDGENIDSYVIKSDGSLTSRHSITATPNPKGVAVSPDGRLVVVANNGELGPPDCCDPHVDGNVSAYLVDQSTGELHPVSGSPFAVGPNYNRITIDPSSKYVYATIEDAGEPTTPGVGGVSVFKIDWDTGKLIPAGAFDTSMGPENITITHR